MNNNLLDYKMATFEDHPDLYGTKALGEPPVCSVAPAIRNAILNATGSGLNELPLNPHRLFAKFREDGLI